MYQEGLNSTHTLEGRDVEELWVAELLEGDVEECPPEIKELPEDDAGPMAQTARRWASLPCSASAGSGSRRMLRGQGL